jgi:hypothetical protein
MRRSIAHAIAFGLLGLIAVAAGTGIAKAAAALDHACCPNETRSETPDDSPCHGFLPLSCCNAAALPAAASAPEAPAPVALPAVPVVAAHLASCAPLPAHALPAPRAAPLLRSVVLQI